MQNKLCLNVRFATGLSPAASSHDLPHAKFIFKRACLETQPGQAMPARQRNLLRFILFDDFSYARFSSYCLYAANWLCNAALQAALGA